MDVMEYALRYLKEKAENLVEVLNEVSGGTADEESS
jgi:hypothetical protein